MTGSESDKESKPDSPPIEELSDEERILVILREELYEGSWDEMEQDLTDRLEGRPYVFKLHNRIEDDLERIGRLKKFEDEHGINLADFLEDLREESDE